MLTGFSWFTANLTCRRGFLHLQAGRYTWQSWHTHACIFCVYTSWLRAFVPNCVNVCAHGSSYSVCLCTYRCNGMRIGMCRVCMSSCMHVCTYVKRWSCAMRTCFLHTLCMHVRICIMYAWRCTHAWMYVYAYVHECMCMHTCMNVCVCIRAWMYVYACVHECMCLHACMNVCVCMRACMYVRACVHEYVSMHACMNMWACMRAWICEYACVHLCLHEMQT